MAQTRWWKCDLQVATPAWDFTFPANSNYKLKDPDIAVAAAERTRFLDDYMAAQKACGVEVIALADHNTGEWIDDAKAAGQRNGVVVFPGCEVTTGTGMDGAHLIVIGDRDKTSQDFDRLVHGPFGFDADGNKPFRMIGGKLEPAPSTKTLNMLLDALPDSYLALAPHALSNNGIASAKTARGDIRFKALHHERLAALDAGDCSQATGDSWNHQFQRREIHDFPRLKSLAFISTSDSYKMEDFGTRFTWIRMAEPTIEALRQAFLDHESRILCHWSPKLEAFQDRNPNNVRHAWISSLTLGGTLSNSTATLSLDLHPGLNVIVGGRGSGKSSVVAALRQLYSTTTTLPQRLKDDAEDFARTVFGSAVLTAKHRIQESQSEQSTRWTLSGGSLTTIEGADIPTTFSATVISQKELFERAAGDKNDPELTSRSLLALVDSGLGLPASWGQSWGSAWGGKASVSQSFFELVEDQRAKWATDRRAFNRLSADLQQLPAVEASVSTLEEQVAAFSAPEVKERLATIEARQSEQAALTEFRKPLDEALLQVDALVEHFGGTGLTAAEGAALPPEFSVVAEEINKLASSFSEALKSASETTKQRLKELDDHVAGGVWQGLVNAAELDLLAYKAELGVKGLSPNEFSRLQEELTRARESVRLLLESRQQLEEIRNRSAASWNALVQVYAHRREARRALLEQVATRSGRLRFSNAVMQDVNPWIAFLRTTAAIRENGYVTEVETLAAWLWKSDESEKQDRLLAWQDFLTTKNVKAFAEVSGFKSAFLDRLANVDESARYRIAAELPEDVASMDFLREGGKPEVDTDWQPVIKGSPGQRTAAMLAFVLHHGREPLVLDQPEDDLDSEWIFKLVVKELRQSRWHRQLIVVSHNANIPVLGDAEQVIALENRAGALAIRESTYTSASGEQIVLPHVGPVETPYVRQDIQSIMEGGVAAFVLREQKYNNETRAHKAI